MLGRGGSETVNSHHEVSNEKRNKTFSQTMDKKNANFFFFPTYLPNFLSECNRKQMLIFQWPDSSQWFMHTTPIPQHTCRSKIHSRLWLTCSLHDLITIGVGYKGVKKGSYIKLGSLLFHWVWSPVHFDTFYMKIGKQLRSCGPKHYFGREGGGEQNRSIFI